MPYPRSSSSAAHYLAFGRQSAGRGTAVAPTLFVPFQGSVEHDQGMAGDDIREAGTGPYVARTMKTGHDPSGGGSMAIRPSTFARLSAWFLGNDAVASAGSLFDHTRTPTETNQWLTAERAAGVDGDIIERFPDSVLTKLSVVLDGNKDVMSSFSWTSLSALWRTAATAQTYESGVSGISPGGPFRTSEATYTLDGAAATNVQMCQIDLEWKYDTDIRLSAVTRREFLKLELTGTVKIKQLIDTATMTDEYRKIVYGSTSGTVPIRNFFQGGALVVALDNGLTTTNARTESITLPVIDWKTAPITEPNPDGATMYLEREGTVRKGAGAFVTMVSRNADTAGYVA